VSRGVTAALVLGACACATNAPGALIDAFTNRAGGGPEPGARRPAASYGVAPAPEPSAQMVVEAGPHGDAGTVEVELEDGAARRAIAGANVTLTHGEDTVAVVTDAAGAVRFDALAPGAYALRVTHQGAVVERVLVVEAAHRIRVRVTIP
jgi:hypothetical protein